MEGRLEELRTDTKNHEKEYIQKSRLLEGFNQERIELSM